MADPPDLLARLGQHRMLADTPREELAWLVDHGSLRHLERGKVLSRKGERIQNLYIVLSGSFAIYVERGSGPRKVMEWKTGDITGVLPYSRLGEPPGDSVSVEPGDVLAIDKAHFPEMINRCPTITAALVHVMVDRARIFKSSELHDEKMMSLGRMSAGLAHELNNPASAAARSTRLLANALADVEVASRALGAMRLPEAQLDALERARATCAERPAEALGPIERSDREEALGEWLESHGVNPDLSAVLVDTAATIDGLDALASVLDRSQLAAGLRWIAAGCSSRMLTSEVERAASRIHELVGAIKRYSYMDRQQGPESIDIAQGLRDSVALLLHKARPKSVSIAVAVPNDLPPVRAIGSDLNQVWTNLLDNAIDAVPESGRIEVSAAPALAFLVVRIIDNGPGIPAEIQERIFDPFFTTKPVGAGTGLGLETARRLVLRNNGDIEVVSQPGRTEFRVSLPIATDTTG